ncbi:MAG: hypothetical protein HY319_04900 [Armatimonadetes bacterium]|nr:hypothetical protein [Armatimonadota bacterium]
MLSRCPFLLAGTLLMALTVLSVELAAPLGYAAIPVVMACFLAAWWAYVRASFPRLAGDAEAPVGETRWEHLASSRALLFGALIVVTLFAPIWFWIVPLFALHAAWRAHCTPGDFGDNFMHELRQAGRFLTRSALNAAVFALACVLGLIAAVGTWGILYFLR